MHFSVSLALLSLASLSFSAQIQHRDWPPSADALRDGTYKPLGELNPYKMLKEREVLSVGSLSPRDPEHHPDLLDSELKRLEARYSGTPGPNLSQNFALMMVYSDEPDKAADFWATKDSFYYFTLRDGQIMLVDDGSDTEHSEDFYYSFAKGYNEWVLSPNSTDHWTIDDKTGTVMRNGQKVFAFCVSDKFPNGVGMQATSGKACTAKSMQFKRIVFKAINRSAQLPPQSGLGWFPQH